jgi:mono/diheme cytochrome c family protein
MTEHGTPQDPQPGAAQRVVGTTEHGSGEGHGPPRHTAAPDRDKLSSTVAVAQFLFTGVILAVVAGLMYTAGLHSGKGGGEAGAPGAPGGAQPAAAVDVQALLKPSPALADKGKNIFAINCASCHGTGGKGDGPAASALNPKPRDFTSGYWRYGGGVARVVQTITNGSPGTAMAPFPGIPLEDRFALAHYVRAFDPAKQEADKPEDLAWLDQFGGGAKKDTTGGATAAAAPAPGDTIPIARAMQLIAERPAGAMAAMAGAPADSGQGAMLFASRCASCHGAWGQGGVRTRMLGSAPYVYITTRSLATPGPLAADAAGFERLLIYGIPGSMHPAHGDLTSEQIRSLFDYTQSLRARLSSAARARS